MAKWPWFERTFTFDYPASKHPDILERVRGMPIRVAERLGGLRADLLTRGDGKGLTIQENIGHLAQVDRLFTRRVEDLMAGVDVLTAAELTGKHIRDANFNDQPFDGIVADLRTRRGELVTRLEGLSEEDWARTAQHPRLDVPMRMVDHVCFIAEHDDYHLARISELIRAFA